MKRTLVHVLVATLGLLVLGAAPARADSTVQVTNDRGGDRADLTYQTRLTVSGSGFQVVPGGLGGVYVLFGWVDDPAGGSWKPSRGGLTGRDYQYIPDAESTADSLGYLRFVAFPGSATGDEAAAVLSSSGGFSVEMTVPGPLFQSVDRDGEVAEVDCRTVTCGVITIGAHGVKNSRNETFTPVAFDRVYDATPTSAPAPTAAPSGSVTPAGPADEPSAAPSAPASGTPSGDGEATRVGTTGVTVDRTTAVSGHAMPFSARGFTPGEQVVAVLDDGTAALGPLVAGASGEVAGVLQLPADLEVGTHELRITGAASGTVLTELFPVAAGSTGASGSDPAGDTTSATSAAATDATGGVPVALVFLAVATAALVLASLAYVRARRRRRGRPVGVLPSVTT